MQCTHIVGIDPGLVHTGVVRMVFEPGSKKVYVSHEAIVGLDTAGVQQWIEDLPAGDPIIFIEGYRPRGNLHGDNRMVAAVSEMRAATGGTVLNNTGVKKVVRRPLMELLGVWSFSTVTHHQDLRSAARIALLGMLKDDDLNSLLADVVSDHINGRTWHVEY